MAFEGPFFVRLNGSTADHTAPGVGQLAQTPLAGESEPASALLAGHTVVLAASLGHSIAAQLGVDLLINTALEPRGSLRRIGFVSPEVRCCISSCLSAAAGGGADGAADAWRCSSRCRWSATTCTSAPTAS